MKRVMTRDSRKPFRRPRVTGLMHTRSNVWSALTASLLALLLCSCASDDRPAHAARPTPPKPAAGEAVYFGGQLAVQVRVAMEFQRPEGGGDRPDGDRGRRDSGGRRGEGGGLSFGGGAGPMHYGSGGGRGEGGPRGDGPPRGSDGGGRPRAMPGGGGLPLKIHVRLQNTGRTPLEVAAPDFVSPLGNFVVQPATLTVPAGESAEFSPMTSFVRGDLPDELPVTLVLRAAGQSEKQVIILRPVAPDAPPAPPKN